MRCESCGTKIGDDLSPEEVVKAVGRATFDPDLRRWAVECRRCFSPTGARRTRGLRRRARFGSRLEGALIRLAREGARSLDRVTADPDAAELLPMIRDLDATITTVLARLEARRIEAREKRWRRAPRSKSEPAPAP